MTRLRRTAGILAATCTLALLTAGCAPEPADAEATAAATPASTAHSAAIATDTPFTPKTQVVTVGDSIMNGMGLADGQAWPELLAAQDGIDLVNLACDGAGFVMIGSCGLAYDGWIADLRAAAPKYVIIQASSNDAAVTEDAVVRETDRTMGMLREALPDTTIIALSAVWNDADDVPTPVDAATSALRAAAAAYGAVFVDVGQPLQGHPEYLQFDEIHPTAEGQIALMVAVDDALKAQGVDITN